MNARAVGIASGVVVAALWGSAFSAIAVALDSFHPLTLVTVRLVIAASVLLVVGMLCRIPLPRRRDLPRTIGCAAIGMTGYQVLLNFGEADVPAGTASMIIAAAPLVAAVAVHRSRTECASRQWWCGSTICAAGVALVCADAIGIAPGLSIGALIAAAAVYGLYGPLLKPLLAAQSGLTVTTHVTVAAAVLSAPLLFLHPLPSASDGTGWSAAVYLGVGPSAAAFLLWAGSLRRLRATETSALLFLVPAFGMTIALVTTAQDLTATAACGTVLVLIGLGVTLRRTTPPGRRRYRGTTPVGPEVDESHADAP